MATALAMESVSLASVSVILFGEIAFVISTCHLSVQLEKRISQRLLCAAGVASALLKASALATQDILATTAQLRRLVLKIATLTEFASMAAVFAILVFQVSSVKRRSHVLESHPAVSVGFVSMACVSVNQDLVGLTVLR